MDISGYERICCPYVNGYEFISFGYLFGWQRISMEMMGYDGI
jgi:hypothetical protein